ncbi:hypothetical protein L6452_20525 [Arctium lappa]|uniref:Uncharacterized protein n=1 Tax=Arctium lappa TaxID=4217 RepID=A0ACB9BC17_ARCLA|nr:hypothetical protein L6452_20525 [Arctium lappa]
MGMFETLSCHWKWEQKTLIGVGVGVGKSWQIYNPVMAIVVVGVPGLGIWQMRPSGWTDILTSDGRSVNVDIAELGAANGWIERSNFQSGIK